MKSNLKIKKGTKVSSLIWTTFWIFRCIKVRNVKRCMIVAVWGQRHPKSWYNIKCFVNKHLPKILKADPNSWKRACGPILLWYTYTHPHINNLSNTFGIPHQALGGFLHLPTNDTSQATMYNRPSRKPKLSAASWPYWFFFKCCWKRFLFNT